MTGHTNATSTWGRGKRGLFEGLEQKILSGDLGEGARLPSERVLAREAGISRPLVREVLRHLTERNLIEVLPGSGSFVRAPGSQDVARSMGLNLRRRRTTPRDLVEARSAIEGTAAEHAAHRATGQDLMIMKGAIERFEAASDLLERVRFDLVFHTSVVRAAHNPVLDTMFAAISESVASMMLRSLADPTVRRAGIPFHDDLLAAIKSRDAEAARRAAVGHMDVALRFYGEDYDADLDALAGKELRHFVDVDADMAALVEADDG